MKNRIASFFRSLAKRFSPTLLRCHAEQSEASVVVAGGRATSPEQFRKWLIEARDDPATARLVAGHLLQGPRPRVALGLY